MLVLSSGDIVHNLAAVDWRHVGTLDAGFDWAFAFRDAVNHAIENRDDDTLVRFEKLGEPARLSVPMPDHYLPLLYVMALRSKDDPITLFNDRLVGGSLSMTSVLVGG